MMNRKLQDAIPLHARQYTDLYPDFYSNPFINAIANKERWTVSDATKRPIDMYELKNYNRIIGATFRSDLCLMTLPDTLDIIPNTTNHAFLIDTLDDNYVMLDIEPTCPDDLKQHFLQMPYVYGETSLSGKGLHLAFPTPACAVNYPDAMRKTALKHESKHYEILMNQYVTFTRNVLPPSTGTASFDNIFETLAIAQKAITIRQINIKIANPDDIPEFDEVIKAVTAKKKFRPLSDFNDDISKWEFSITGTLKGPLLRCLKAKGKRLGYEYDDNETAMLLYTAMKDSIPPRSKHTTYRDGMPFLLYMAYDALSKSEAKKTKKGD